MNNQQQQSIMAPNRPRMNNAPVKKQMRQMSAQQLRRSSMPPPPSTRMPPVPLLPQSPNAQRRGSTYDLWRITRHSCHMMQVMNSGRKDNMLKRLLITNMLQKVYKISQDMIKQNQKNRIEQHSKEKQTTSSSQKQTSTPTLAASDSKKHRTSADFSKSIPAIPQTQQRQQQPQQPQMPSKSKSCSSVNKHHSVDKHNSSHRQLPLSQVGNVISNNPVAEDTPRRKGRKLKMFKGFFSKKTHRPPPVQVESLA